MAEYFNREAHRSESDNGTYIAAVKEATYDNQAFAKFKRDSRYTDVLEHVSILQGKHYLEIIQADSPDLLRRINDFMDNDLEGGAQT